MQEPRRRGVEASPRGGGGAGRPFRWVDVAALAGGYPRVVVRSVVADELRQGRIESDGNGHLRIRPERFAPKTLEALRTLSS
jgi:hypothetical protein